MSEVFIAWRLDYEEQAVLGVFETAEQAIAVADSAHRQYAGYGYQVTRNEMGALTGGQVVWNAAPHDDD